MEIDLYHGRAVMKMFWLYRMCIALETYKGINFRNLGEISFALWVAKFGLLMWGLVTFPFWITFPHFNHLHTSHKGPKRFSCLRYHCHETQQCHELDDQWTGQCLIQNNGGRSSGINAHSNTRFLRAGLCLLSSLYILNGWCSINICWKNKSVLDL